MVVSPLTSPRMKDRVCGQDLQDGMANCRNEEEMQKELESTCDKTRETNDTAMRESSPVCGRATAVIAGRLQEQINAGFKYAKDNMDDGGVIEKLNSDIGDLLGFPLQVKVFIPTAHSTETVAACKAMQSYANQPRNELAELVLMGPYSGIRRKICYGPAMFYQDGAEVHADELLAFSKLLKALSPIHNAGHAKEIVKSYLHKASKSNWREDEVRFSADGTVMNDREAGQQDFNQSKVEQVRNTKRMEMNHVRSAWADCVPDGGKYYDTTDFYWHTHRQYDPSTFGSHCGVIDDEVCGGSIPSVSRACGSNTDPLDAFSCGLSNIGNTCFMASAVQCLLHCAQLREYFRSRKFEEHLNPDNFLGSDNAVLTRGFAHTIDSIDHEMFLQRRDQQHDKNDATGWFGLDDFYKAVVQSNELFGGFGQHDSQELLSYALDMLHEDTNQILKKPYVELPDFNEGTKSEADVAWDAHKQRNKSVVDDMYQAQIGSRIECPDCGHTSHSYDPSSVLSLPIPRKCSVLVHDGRESIRMILEPVPKNMDAMLIRIAEELTKHFARKTCDPDAMNSAFACRQKTDNLTDIAVGPHDVYVRKGRPQSFDFDTDQEFDPDNPPEFMAWYIGGSGGIGEQFATMTSDDKIFLIIPRVRDDHHPDFGQIGVVSNLCGLLHRPIDMPHLVIMSDTDAQSPIGAQKLARYCRDLWGACSVKHADEQPIPRNGPLGYYRGFRDTKRDSFRYQRGLPRDETPESTNRQVVIFADLDNASPAQVATLDNVATVCGGGGKLSISTLLEEYTKEEILEEGDEWYCSKCQEHRRANKRVQIISK